MPSDRNICEHEGCHVQGSYAYTWADTFRYCRRHKLTGMRNVVAPICVYPDCNMIATFRMKDSTVRISCRKHANNNMEHYCPKLLEKSKKKTESRRAARQHPYADKAKTLQIPPHDTLLDLMMEELSGGFDEHSANVKQYLDNAVDNWFAMVSYPEATERDLLMNAIDEEEAHREEILEALVDVMDASE